jgi:hypothetical protein
MEVQTTIISSGYNRILIIKVKRVLDNVVDDVPNHQLKIEVAEVVEN